MPKRRRRKSSGAPRGTGRRRLSKHDQTIERLAKRYLQQGAKVQADLPGWPRPRGIGRHGRRPDLVVFWTDGSTELVEVEHANRLGTKAHKAQMATFHRSARQRVATRVTLVTVG